MESILGIVAFTYAAVAVIIYIIVYIIEVVLDLPLWENDDLPGVSHVKLKRIIEQIIHETLRLPALFDDCGVSRRPEESLPFFDPKKYQDLLATAVLNKIVDSYNYENKFENHSKTPNNNADLDKNYNPLVPTKTQTVSLSSSSIEPQNDSSVTDPTISIVRDHDAYQRDPDSHLQSDITTKNVHTDDDSLLSNYIAKHKVPLPELTIDSESPDDDDFISGTAPKSVEGNWEDNWLFKRKKRGNETSGSVGMLVPSPREAIQTLIGDKAADEVSDLSEGSDFEDTESSENKIPTETDLLNVLVQSKNVIGGKNTVGLFDELLEQTSLISTTSMQDGETAFAECKNDFVLNNDGLNDTEVSKLNLINNINNNIMIRSEPVNYLTKTDLLKNNPATASNDDDAEAVIISPPEVHFTNERRSLECTTDSVPESESLTIGNTLEKMETKEVTTGNVQSSEDASVNFDPSNQVNYTGPNVTNDDCDTTAEKPIIDPPLIEAQSLSSSTETRDMHKESSQSTHTSSAQSEQDAQNQATDNKNSLTNFTNKTNSNGLYNSHLKLEAVKNSTFSKLLRPAENCEEDLSHFFPGSIAERERLKWYQTVDMPNNPYSPEALKQRLSTVGSEKPIDIPNINANLDLSSSESKQNTFDQEVEEGNKSLQIVIGDNKPDVKRYGRDYYINDAKHACGKSRRTENVTEPLLSSSSTAEGDTPTENKVKHSAAEPDTNSSIPTIQRSSSCSEKRSAESCDIFSAQPVRVEESDPILNKAFKLEYLNTPERDLYFLPNEEIGSLKSSSQSDNSSLISQNTESLTASEDSWTIRVYDLKKQEIRIVNEDKVTETLLPETRATRPQSFTAKPEQNQQQLTRTVTTPTSLKFLQPKRKEFNLHRIMSVDSGLKSTLFENNNMMTSTSIDSAGKLVIEEELISALPSVKALAKVFSLNSPGNISPAFKSPSNYSLDMSEQPIAEETHTVTPVREPFLDSYVSSYNQAYSPLQTSATTKPASNPVLAKNEPIETLIEATETHEEVNGAIEQQQKEERGLEVRVKHKDETIEELIPNEKSSVPERPISPVLVPGQLKNNIAFFENLKNK